MSAVLDRAVLLPPSFQSVMCLLDYPGLKGAIVEAAMHGESHMAAVEEHGKVCGGSTAKAMDEIFHRLDSHLHRLEHATRELAMVPSVASRALVHPVLEVVDATNAHVSGLRLLCAIVKDSVMALVHKARRRLGREHASRLESGLSPALLSASEQSLTALESRLRVVHAALSASEARTLLEGRRPRYLGALWAALGSEDLPALVDAVDRVVASGSGELAAAAARASRDDGTDAEPIRSTGAILVSAVVHLLAASGTDSARRALASVCAAVPGAATFPDVLGRSPLRAAAIGGSASTVALLYRHGARPEIESIGPGVDPPIHIAARKGDPELIWALFRKIESVETRLQLITATDGDGLTPVAVAASTGNHLTLDALLQIAAAAAGGISPLFEAHVLWAPLTFRHVRKHTDTPDPSKAIPRIVKDSEVDVTVLKRGESALSEGLVRVSSEVRPKWPPAPNASWSALHLASLAGFDKCVRVLTTAAGQSGERGGWYLALACGPRAETALHAAARSGRLVGAAACARILAGSGAPRLAFDTDGRTPLHAATKNGAEDVLAALLVGVPPSVLTPLPPPALSAPWEWPEAAPDWVWAPLLHEAVEANRAGATTLLLRAGADPGSVDSVGWSAEALALFHGYETCSAAIHGSYARRQQVADSASESVASEDRRDRPVLRELLAEEEHSDDDDRGGHRTEQVMYTQREEAADERIERGHSALAPGTWELRVRLGGYSDGDDLGKRRLPTRQPAVVLTAAQLEQDGGPKEVCLSLAISCSGVTERINLAATREGRTVATRPPGETNGNRAFVFRADDPEALGIELMADAAWVLPGATGETVGSRAQATVPAAAMLSQGVAIPWETALSRARAGVRGVDWNRDVHWRGTKLEVAKDAAGPRGEGSDEEDDEDDEEHDGHHHKVPFSGDGEKLTLQKSTSSEPPLKPQSPPRTTASPSRKSVSPPRMAPVFQQHVPPSRAERQRRAEPKMEGEITVPLMDANRAIAGTVTLRFLFVRPYVPHPRALAALGGIHPALAPSVPDEDRDRPHTRPRSYWRRTRIVGHRGAGADRAAVVTAQGVRRRRTHVLENTLLSFVTAASVGAEYVEFDVHLTRDGVPVVHHNFTVRVRPDAPDAPPLEIPVSLLSSAELAKLVPEANVRNHATATPGAPKPRASPDEHERPLRALGLDATAHAKRSHLFYGLKDRFVTLEAVFRQMDKTCGFNIEVKYPLPSEERVHGFTAPERNEFVERVLDVVFATAGNRPVVFSSFDPDICLLLARKQAVFPVFLLTSAGTEPTADPRRASLRAAIGFARATGLLGVVSEVAPLLRAPRLIDAVLGNGLILATYGRGNNQVEAVQLQRNRGVSFVILDHVAHVTKALSAMPQDSPKPTK